MKEGPQKRIALLRCTTQTTTTSQLDLLATEEYDTLYHIDYVQEPQKSITHLTTQIATTSQLETSATEEHCTSNCTRLQQATMKYKKRITSYHTDVNKKPTGNII